MRTKILASSFILNSLLLFCATLAQAQTKQIQNPLLVWEDLPYLRTGVQVWSHTSKNPFNRTVQDWLNYTTPDNNYYECANLVAPQGMLVHNWFTFLNRDSTGDLKLWFNKNDKASFEKNYKDYFNTSSYPFSLWETKDNIWWSFPGLPFKGRFKATTSYPPHWYQYTLHTYRDKKYDESLSQASIEIIAKKISNAGTYPGTESNLKTSGESATLKPGDKQVIFEKTNAGVLRQIWLMPTNFDSLETDSLYIRIETDGLETASLPVSLFFGGYPKSNMNFANGLPAGLKDKRLYNFFPMPFWKSLRIELESRAVTDKTFTSEFKFSDTNPYPAASTGTFFVKYNPATEMKKGDPDFVHINTMGSGIFVGLSSQLTGSIESNFSIYTDGKKTPVIESTGGEDYYNHSFGIHPGFSRPFSGGLGKIAAYRFHIMDYVPFLNSLMITQDHGEYWNHEKDGTFISAVFYYLNKKSYLTVTDSIDIGKPKSEKAHQYSLNATKQRLQHDNGSYEAVYEKVFDDEGRWSNGTSTFTAAIDPKNTGIRLRKRINQEAYHQGWEVYADDKLVGTWFEQGANYNLNRLMYWNDSLPNWEKGDIKAKFRDTEFNIPASFTKGKSKIKIRLRSTGSLAVKKEDAGLTNEYFYWVLSYLPF